MTLSTLDQAKIDRIRQELTWHPAGMTISALSARMKVNRNLLAKYLDILLISGQVTIQITGTAKVYSLSRQIPIADLLNCIPDPVLILDGDLKILQVNESLLSFLQEQKDALLGKRFDESGNPFLSGLQLSGLSKAGASSKDTAIEATGTIGGESRRVRVRPVPVVFDNGSRGFALFIGEAHGAGGAPVSGAPPAVSYEGVVEDQAGFVVRFLPDGTFTFANDAFCRYLHKEPHELAGRSFLALLPEEDRDPVAMGWHGLDSKNPVVSLEHRMTGPSGLPRWHRWTTMALFDGQGRTCGYQSAGRDITDESRADVRINQHIADRWLLNKKAMELVALPADANIYDVIGRGVKEILPDAMVAVNSFDRSQDFLTTRCFLGNRERELFSKLIGEDVVGMAFNVPDTVERSHVIRNLLGGQLIKVPGNLEVMLMGLVPRALCEKIEKALDIGDMYVIGLVHRNVLMGNVCLLLRKGDVLEHSDVLEIYLRMASLGLKCRLYEEAGKEACEIEDSGTGAPAVRGSVAEGEVPVIPSPGRVGPDE